MDPRLSAVLPGPPPSGLLPPRGFGVSRAATSASVGPSLALQTPPLGTLPLGSALSPFLSGVGGPASPQDPRPAFSPPPLEAARSPPQPRQPPPSLLPPGPAQGAPPPPLRAEALDLSKARRGGVRGAHAFGEPSPGRAALRTECSGGLGPGGRGREPGRHRGGGRAECRSLSGPPPPRARASGGGREKDSRLQGSLLCQCGGARERRGARGAEGAEAVATLARVLGRFTRRPGPPPSSRPLRAAAPSPSAPRGFLQTSARVSGGRGPLLRSAGGLFLVPFRSSAPQAGRCLFLETLFSAVPGVLWELE